MYALVHLGMATWWWSQGFQRWRRGGRRYVFHVYYLNVLWAKIASASKISCGLEDSKTIR